MAHTTIQISTELLEKLKERKLYTKETYEEVIWDALEDSMELSEESKKNIKIAEKQIARGEVVSLDEVEKRISKLKKLR